MSNQPPQKFTLRDVAAAAGVSPMTASRVLSGNARVSKSKSEAVRKAAERLGYQVNTIVRTVMSEMRRRQSTTFAGVLGFLNTSRDENAWRQLPYNREYLDGARQRAEATGFALDEIWINAPHWTPHRTEQVLKARGIRGFLIPPGSGEPQFRFALDDFAMSSFGGLAFSLQVPQVLPDYFHNYSMCYQELWNIGYRKIGVFIPEYDLRISADEVLGGVLSAQWRHPKKHHVPIGTGSVNWQLAEDAFCRWVIRYQPDAIIADYNEVPAWLRRIGLKVPQDVGLAHPALGPDVEHWSGIDMRRALQASQAVDLLTGQLLRNECGIAAEPKTVILPGKWIPGKTTGRVAD